MQKLEKACLVCQILHGTKITWSMYVGICGPVDKVVCTGSRLSLTGFMITLMQPRPYPVGSALCYPHFVDN